MKADTSDLNHGDYERVACIVFVALVPTVLLTRFWSRMLSKQVGSDDWAALAAGVSRSTQGNGSIYGHKITNKVFIQVFALSSSIQTLVGMFLEPFRP